MWQDIDLNLFKYFSIRQAVLSTVQPLLNIRQHLHRFLFFLNLVKIFLHLSIHQQARSILLAAHSIVQVHRNIHRRAHNTALARHNILHHHRNILHRVRSTHLLLHNILHHRHNIHRRVRSIVQIRHSILRQARRFLITTFYS